MPPMGSTPVPPLAPQDLTTTKFDVGGVHPPWGLSGLTTTRGGSGGAVLTDIHTNADTTGKERTKDRRVTTTRGGSGERGYPSDRPEVFNHQPNKVGVVPFRGRGSFTTAKLEGGGLCAKHQFLQQKLK